MFQGPEDEAFLAYSKIQSLLKGGFEHDTSIQLDNFDYDPIDNMNAIIDMNPVVNSTPDDNRGKLMNELFPSPRSSESIFQELLQECMQKYSDCIVGVVPGDNLQHADIASRYTAAAGKRYFESDRLLESIKKSDPQLQRDALQDKAERDLWSLLEILCRANLLDDIDDVQSEHNLQSIISSLPVTASIPDFINAAYAHDQRIRKGAVLKEWLERAAADKLHVPMAPYSVPFNDTLKRLLMGRSNRRGDSNATSLVESMHPDAQLTSDGHLMSMDGLDRSDQEILLKAIFALIRSGQIPRAQQLAADHRVYWLAASLEGVSSHFHKAIELPSDGEMQEDDGSNVVGFSRVGNARQPVWARSCWKYSAKLASNPSNWSGQVSQGQQRDFDDLLFGVGSSGKSDPLVGTLECSIYAALSNNTKVLLQSSLLTSWHDQVWVLLKAAHERDLTKVLHRYRCLKSAHSALYPGCDAGVIAAERELLDLGKLELDHLSTGNCSQIFNKVPPPNTLSAESLLLKLQAAVMEGRSGIAQYIASVMVPTLRANYTTDSLNGLAKVLRVFCHFIIWLKYSPQGGPLAPLVSDEVLFLAIEQYIAYLISTRQYNLIAPYAAYLNRPRRIAQYCTLLRAIRTSADEAADPTSIHQPSGQSAEAAEVLQLASLFFPLDVMDITRSVVESSQELSLAQQQHHALSSSMVVPAAPAASSPTAASGGQGRNVHFSEVESAPVTPLVSRSGVMATPATDRFANIRGRQATPGILRQGVSMLSPESPGALVPLDSSAVSALPEQPSTEQEKEQLQMESLRWLFFDPSHRLEAVKQTNRLISTLLAESAGTKLAQVRLLLTEYLPFDSVTVGYSLLRQRQAEVENVVKDHMIRRQLDTQSFNSNSTNQIEAENAAVSQLEEALALDELCWESSVSKLELWKSLVGAMEDFDTFKNVVIEYNSAASQMIGSPVVLRSSLGKYRSKVEQAARTATEALTRTVECLPYSKEYDNPAGGYRDIWTKADEAVGSSVVHLVRDLMCVLAEYNPAEAHITGEDNTEVLQSIKREVEEVEQISGRVSLDLVQGSVTEVVGRLTDCVSSCPTNDSDLLLKVFTTVNQVKLNLLDHYESVYLRSLLINKLLSSYLQVCMDCAAVMSTLEHPKEACLWYYNAVKLANLIASDENCLQLETLLSRGDLEALVSTINKASINALRIDPDFNVV